MLIDPSRQVNIEEAILTPYNTHLPGYEMERKHVLSRYGELAGRRGGGIYMISIWLVAGFVLLMQVHYIRWQTLCRRAQEDGSLHK